MNKTIKFYLPTVQTTFAALLMFLSWRKKPWTTGGTLESRISYAINAPASFLSFPLARLVSDKWPLNNAAWFFFNYIFYFALVAALWYAVAIEIGGTAGSSLLSQLVPVKALRRISAAALIGFGLLLLFVSFMNLTFPQGGREFTVIGVLLWGIAIAVFYTWDLFKQAGGG